MGSAANAQTPGDGHPVACAVDPKDSDCGRCG